MKKRRFPILRFHYVEVGLPNKLASSGVDLLETCTVLGDESLAGGQLVLSMPAATSPSGLGGTALPRDAFLLRLTSTTAGSGLTSGTARLLFEGADLGLDSGGEDLDGLSVVAP